MAVVRAAAHCWSAGMQRSAMRLRPSRRPLSTVPTAFALKKASHAGYIGGVWVGARSGRLMPVYNPSTGAVLAQVPDMGADETTAAVAAAKAAFPAWSARTAADRGALLRKVHDLLLKHSDGLAALLTAECGKPFEESKGEIAYAASFFEWFSEEAKRAYGDVIPGPRSDRRILAIRQPLGVAALLTPWNFSAAMPARKIAPALAAGCTVVCRPAANTPLSAVALVQLVEAAGVPAGVVNLVMGADHDALAGTLCRHADVAKVSFTGSTPVGRLLMQQCAPTLKKLSLELGGNAPFIVFGDADVEAAVEGCIASKFRNAGQTCVCANRVLVHSSVYDAFVARLSQRVRDELRVGDGMAAGVKCGPLISEAALRKTEALVADALALGARALTGGRRAVVAGAPAGGAATGATGGWFFEPTVLEGVGAGMRVTREEIFGPVAPVARFESEADALRLANDAEVGLAAYVYTRDLSRAWRMAEALEVGMVGVNTGIISTAAAPFGGVKQSGFGREGSKYGMDEYSAVKYIMMGL